MIANNLSLPNVLYWIFIIIGIIFFCISENQTNHSRSGNVMTALSCIISGANGIYRTVVQEELIYIVYILFIAEFAFLATALFIEINKTSINAIPYVLGRYLLGCLIMCAPISIINASKALGGLVGAVAVIIIFYLLLKDVDIEKWNKSLDTVSITINGESCIVLNRASHAGGEEIEYGDSHGNTGTLSQMGLGSYYYKTESGETVQMQADSYFNSL